MGPAKPLTADEIVKANAKKRAAGGQIGAPAKLGRLDAATMAALGRKGSGSGQLTGRGLGLVPGQGTGQLLGQGQLPGRGSGLLSGQGSGQFAGHNPGQMSGQDFRPLPGRMQGQAPGQGSGQLQGQGVPGPAQLMQPNAPGPTLTPGHVPVSPGLPSMSPMGPGGLLSPPSGLGNLFNEEVSPVFAVTAKLVLYNQSQNGREQLCLYICCPLHCRLTAPAALTSGTKLVSWP